MFVLSLLLAATTPIASAGSSLRDSGLSPSWAEAYRKADTAVAKLSLDDKVGLVTPHENPCTGNTSPAQAIGYPSLCLKDSPLGITDANGNATAFTPGIMAGSTWDVNLIRQRGEFLGEESKAAGINAQLGPVAGALGKIAHAGRNWEGFSVDPYLQGIAVAHTVEGMQGAGVQAVTKHFIANEQELNRETISSNVNDRVIHELYLWPFADAVHSNTAAVMCSYNKLNSTWACEDDHSLNGLLKTELGFQGYVIADWGAQHSTEKSALSGLDMASPRYGLWGANLTTAVSTGKVPVERLNDMVRRILASWYFLNQDENYPPVNITAAVRGSHEENVRAVARDGIVLLRNKGNILPLSKPSSLAVIGSASVPNPDGYNSCGERACNKGALGMGWGSGTADYPYFVSPHDAIKQRASGEGTTVILSATDDPVEGAKAAQGKDAAIVVITSDSGEEYITVEGNHGDRNNLDPWHQGNELVTAVAAENPNTIVVIHSVGPIILEKILDSPGVKAIVWAGLPSSESGNALVDILYGETSPSGKLPYTIARNESDYPAMIVTTDNDDFVEGLYIDYRHFDAKEIVPRYEFGYGLSYTSFDYSNIQANSTARAGPASGEVIPGGRADLWGDVATVTCTVTNNGSVAGAEVVQLYISMPSTAPEAPPRQLRGFAKLRLEPGGSEMAVFKLRRRDLSFWDVSSQEWVLPDGSFGVFLGASSRDIRLTGSISTTTPVYA
ncbi:beta-glucosidase [Pochonia chlamydosporia 170]|uniref:Beta-glucosidase cel3A n=1 Tax=Pochonia chlamydosporia 170 TaxID=1380566 RepID=A0A179EW69_METCM|nr:beta-glucosidase [Pochonia chlamydosporia 170]OAQ57427.2 beta-glucosidase [Pochonia chlamydosporia 170]